MYPDAQLEVWLEGNSSQMQKEQALTLKMYPPEISNHFESLQIMQKASKFDLNFL